MSMRIDIHARTPGAGGRWPRMPAVLIAVALAALGMSGCTPPRKYSSVTVTSTPSSTVAPARTSREPSLAAIIGDQLQLGHYAEGERALRQYLKQHPGDRAAQAMLHQLTADPGQTLGERWRAHVVRPGDSYSTLAARYLGDPNLFLILARYNGSTNPSMLRVGETLHMPLSAGTDAAVAATAPTPATMMPTAIARSTETPAAKAKRLQDESMSLLERGHQDQALARLDEALTADPKLKPGGARATALRTQLLDQYHERAIVLYRDQQLDKAIALWDRVLEIAPDYEPAIVYRTRARELKQRLKQY